MGQKLAPQLSPVDNLLQEARFVADKPQNHKPAAVNTPSNSPLIINRLQLKMKKSTEPICAG